MGCVTAKEAREKHMAHVKAVSVGYGICLVSAYFSKDLKHRIPGRIPMASSGGLGVWEIRSSVPGQIKPVTSIKMILVAS